MLEFEFDNTDSKDEEPFSLIEQFVFLDGNNHTLHSSFSTVTDLGAPDHVQIKKELGLYFDKISCGNIVPSIPHFVIVCAPDEMNPHPMKWEINRKNVREALSQRTFETLPPNECVKSFHPCPMPGTYLQ